MAKSRSKMSGNVLTHVSEYLLNLEQHLLAITYSLIGASAGVLVGSVSGAKRLTQNFSSTDGFKDLIYGSEHRDEKDRRSVSDLLKSWVPGFHKSSESVKQIEGPKLNGVANQAHTNGASAAETVKETGAAVAEKAESTIKAPPASTHNRPVVGGGVPMEPHELPSNYPTRHISATTKETEIQPRQVPGIYDTSASFTDQLLGSAPRINSVTSTDVSGSSEVWEGEEGDDEGDDIDEIDDGTISKKEKAKERLKKMGKKVKKVFKPLTRLGHSHDNEVAAPVAAPAAPK